MRVKNLLIITLLSLLSIITSCTQKQKVSSNNTPTSPKVILEVDQKKITADDFLYVYEKNRKQKESNHNYEDLKKYMDLFLTFQLKVAEAESQKLDTLPQFIKEFEGYRVKLAKPYLTDAAFTKKWAKIQYERQKEEVNASHILIKIQGDQLPSDTLAAYNKILSIKKEINSGVDFGESAIKYSDDPSAKMEQYPLGYKGNLGYFSAFDMVFEFENAAFQNPVGSLVGPIKTQFGYHLLKIHDKRPAQPKRDVSHIMILAADKINKEDSISAAKKIYEIKSKVTKENWNDICQKYSDHAKTKDKGGALGVIKVGGKLGSPEFEKVAFALKNVGDISDPVKSAYGWHIIKLNAKVAIPSYEDQEKELENKVSKNGAIVEMGRKQFAEKIKKENNFKENLGSLEEAKNLLDSTYLTNKWVYNENNLKLNLVLFSIGVKKYRVNDLFVYLKDYRSWYQKKGLETTFLKDYESYKTKSLFNYEESNLTEKHPSYRHLVQEYRDGILLFDLMNKTIWSKSASDTLAIQQFYKKNKDTYQWKDRAKAIVYYLYDTTKVKELRTSLAKGESPTEDSFNANSSLALKIKSMVIENNTKNKDFKGFKLEKGLQEFSRKDYKIFVVTEEIIPASYKKLNECKGQVISDYQVQLEKEWIEELKQTHSYKVHDDVLKELAEKN